MSLEARKDPQDCQALALVVAEVHVAEHPQLAQGPWLHLQHLRASKALRVEGQLEQGRWSWRWGHQKQGHWLQGQEGQEQWQCLMTHRGLGRWLWQ